MATQLAKPNSDIKLIENQSNLQFPVNYSGDKGLGLLLANFIASMGSIEYLTTAQFLNGQFPNAPDGYTAQPCVLPGAVQRNVIAGNDTITTIKYVDTYIIGNATDQFTSDFNLGMYLGSFDVNGEKVVNSYSGRLVNIFFVKNNGIGINNFIDIGKNSYADTMFRTTTFGCMQLRFTYIGTIDVVSVNNGYNLFESWDGLKTSTKINLASVINEVYDLAFAGGAGPAGGVLTGNYPNPQLGIEVVNTGNLANGSVATERIANGAITTAKIANGAVATNSIADRAITGVKLLGGTVGAYEIENGAITTEKLAAGAVTPNQIQDGAVNVNKLSVNSVIEEKIANNAVTVNKIADGSITTPKIATGAVGTAQIASIAITNEKIADRAVSIIKLDKGISDRLAYGFFGGKFDVASGTIISQFSTMSSEVAYQVGPSPDIENTLVFTFNNPTVVMMMDAVIAQPLFSQIAEDGVTLSTFVSYEYNTVSVKVLFKSVQGTSLSYPGAIYVVFYLGQAIAVTT